MNINVKIFLLFAVLLITFVSCESDDSTAIQVPATAFSGTLTNQFPSTANVSSRIDSSTDFSSNTSETISVSAQGSKMAHWRKSYRQVFRKRSFHAFHTPPYPRRPGGTVADLYLETSYIWTVTLFKSDLHFQISFWINLNLAAADSKS